METVNRTAESRGPREPVRVAIGGPLLGSPMPARSGPSRKETRWPVDLLVVIAVFAVAGAAALGGLAISSTWMTLVRSQATYSLGSGDLEGDLGADLAAPRFTDAQLCCHETR